MNYILDGKRMNTKENAHAYLREVFDFPAYYGGNLDALSDCLTECGRITVTVEHSQEMLNTLGGYGKGILRVLQEAENIRCTIL